MAKTRFPFSRGTVYYPSPEELCIIGGLSLPDGQRGLNDTEVDTSHHLYDQRLQTVQITEPTVRNVDYYGVLEPVLVSKDEQTGLATVVDGRGRVRRARLANLLRAERGEPPISVPAIEVKLDEVGQMGAMVACNEARDDDGPLVKLAKAKALMARGVSEVNAALTFGLDMPYFKALLSYDESATQGVKEAVAEGMLTPTAAMELVRVAQTPEAQTEALASVTASGKPATVREARDAAKVASGKANKETGAGLAPSKRELAALMALLAGQNELTVEALVIRDGGEAAEGIEATADHVAASYMHGAEAALALVLGKTTDATLLTLLARARRGLAK